MNCHWTVRIRFCRIHLFYFVPIQISILNEQENFNSVCPVDTSVSKSLVSFASLPGQIMTSILIQFVRLVAAFASLERVVNYNRKVICWVDCLGRFETKCLLVTRFRWLCSWSTMIHTRLITGWAHGTTVLRKWKNICLPLGSSLKRSLPSQNT